VGHDIALDEPARLTFLVPLAGGLGVDAGRGRLEARSGGGLLLGTGHRSTQVRAPRSGLFRALVAMTPCRSDPDGGPAETPFRTVPRLGAEPAARALTAYLHYLARELVRPDGALKRPTTRRAAGALILDLMAELDQVGAGTPASGSGAAEGRVRLAEGYMEARAGDELTMAEVARAAGIGVRALQLDFQRIRGMSPRAVLHRFRLERAYARLLAGDPATTVTEIALLCGFTHLGRFAASYRARFGETPSETLARGRR
jgi:AraC-like DNA-binding protein